MNLKEVVLKSIKEINKPTTHREIYDHIIDNKYYDFLEAKTPEASVSAVLGNSLTYTFSKLTSTVSLFRIIGLESYTLQAESNSLEL